MANDENQWQQVTWMTIKVKKTIKGNSLDINKFIYQNFLKSHTNSYFHHKTFQYKNLKMAPTF